MGSSLGSPSRRWSHLPTGSGLRTDGMKMSPPRRAWGHTLACRAENTEHSGRGDAQCLCPVSEASS